MPPSQGPYGPGPHGAPQPQYGSGGQVPAQGWQQPQPWQGAPATSQPQHGAPQTVPGQQGQPKTDWAYGLPPGSRPDLLQAPLGQHGAMAGSVWQQSGARKTGFAHLVIVELQKLVGTLSDRLMLAASPVLMALLTWAMYSTFAYNSGSFGGQLAPAVFTALFGPTLVYLLVIKSVSGEWHYRSIQYTLLLQPSRPRYVAALVCAVAVLWAVLSGLVLVVSIPLSMITLGSSLNPNLLLQRPLAAVLAVVLAVAVGLLVSLVFAVWFKNPAAALISYFVAASTLLLFQTQLTTPVAGFFDPYQVVAVVTEYDSGVLQAFVSVPLWLAILAGGVLTVLRRDTN